MTRYSSFSVGSLGSQPRMVNFFSDTKSINHSKPYQRPMSKKIDQARGSWKGGQANEHRPLAVRLSIPLRCKLWRFEDNQLWYLILYLILRSEERKRRLGVAKPARPRDASFAPNPPPVHYPQSRSQPQFNRSDGLRPNRQPRLIPACHDEASSVAIVWPFAFTSIGAR